MFTLHPTLKADTVLLTSFDLCDVLLMNESRYPWLILVPRREGLRDLDDLSAEDLSQAQAEIVAASKALKATFSPYKINVAALGNVVEQLHIHVIARFQDDAAWPKPVWGVFPSAPYDDTKRAEVQRALLPHLG